MINTSHPLSDARLPREYLFASANDLERRAPELGASSNPSQPPEQWANWHVQLQAARSGKTWDQKATIHVLTWDQEESGVDIKTCASKPFRLAPAITIAQLSRDGNPYYQIKTEDLLLGTLWGEGGATDPSNTAHPAMPQVEVSEAGSKLMKTLASVGLQKSQEANELLVQSWEPQEGPAVRKSMKDRLVQHIQETQDSRIRCNKAKMCLAEDLSRFEGPEPTDIDSRSALVSSAKLLRCAEFSGAVPSGLRPSVETGVRVGKYLEQCRGEMMRETVHLPVDEQVLERSTRLADILMSGSLMLGSLESSGFPQSTTQEQAGQRTVTLLNSINVFDNTGKPRLGWYDKLYKAACSSTTSPVSVQALSDAVSNDSGSRLGQKD